MTITTYLAVAGAAYLLGSFPTGYLVGRFRGVDIRSLGSGNIGATNVFRILGRTAGIVVLVADGLKGYLACRLVAGVAARLSGIASDAASGEQLSIIAGVAAILGHNYSCWLRFKGGKGIATSAGVLTALLPGSLLIILATWILVFALSRYVSLASIMAAALLPFATWWSGQSRQMVLVSIALGALAIYKHKANIQRLLRGEEHRFGSRR